MPVKLILDCDPGIDDAVAIALALASPELDVRGISVCHGNVPLERTKANALSMLALLESDIEVYAGASCALIRSEISAGDVHGETGLGGIPMPASSRAISGRRATDFIIDEVRAHPGEITLVGVGPLTNLALAMRLAPDIVPLISRIVIMGGAVGAGNRTASAEFNIYADPHAAKIVFECGCPFTMFGLDVTHKAIATPARVAALRALGGPVGGTIASLLEVYRVPYQRQYGWDGAAVHDMCAIAYLIDPSLFTTQSMSVRVDIHEGPNFGRTVCDSRHRDPAWSRVDVATDVDAERLFALLTERIATYKNR
jgi:purine nucleosidase